MPKRMSDKQLAANRRNARKSTGPRTAEGRGVSSLNALKHGILSEQAVVCSLHCRESIGEFRALHRRFTEDLQPRGPVEEMLVDQIVTCHWRLCRALKAEAGEIALSVDQEHQRRNRPPDVKLLWMTWQMSGDPIQAMMSSRMGLGYLRGKLRKVRVRIEGGEELGDEDIDSFCINRSEPPNSLMIQLKRLREQARQNPEGLDGAALRNQNRERLLCFIDLEMATIHMAEKELAKREEAEERARGAAAHVPGLPALERIQRYETKLERQLHRAMLQLERFQRRRQGDVVPAPITVEVSERERE